MIELKAVNVEYCSDGDEAAFFEWIKKIPSIKDFRGSGNSLSIMVDEESIDEYDLRELIALFYRYDVPMKQLAIFDREEFSIWLHIETAFWHGSMFETA